MMDVFIPILQTEELKPEVKQLPKVSQWIIVTAWIWTQTYLVPSK